VFLVAVPPRPVTLAFGEGGRRMAAGPFPWWLAEVAADAVVVRPDDIIAEASGNLWTFGLDDDQRVATTLAAVEEFVRAVAAARRGWLADHGLGPMRFYCWHDAQAGQLRFSLVSAGPAALPFRCPVDPTVDLAVVARGFLGTAAVLPPAPLSVWVAVVP
jgi:hypothetical protein